MNSKKSLLAPGTLIAQRYGINSLDKKAENKTSLQEKIGWAAEPKRPVVCLPAGMSDALGGDLLKEVMQGLLELPVEILILGRGSQEYGKYFTQLQHDHDHRVYIVPDTESGRQSMYAAADMALFLEDPKGSDEVLDCLAYGCVPIAPASKALEDYNPVQEKGTAFLYGKKNTWHCFGALVRALETYKFPFDWRTIQKHCMEAGAQ